MLLRQGIISSRRRHRAGTRKQHWTTALYIYGANAKRFARKVGFVSRWKQARLAGTAGQETKYLVPVPRTFDAPNADMRGTISRHVAQKRKLTEELRYHHDRVRSIEAVVSDVYCIEVPNSHRFLQNGFDGWNSQGSEWPATIVVCHPTHSFMLTRQLLYTAVTRAKKRVCIVGTKKGIEQALRTTRDAGRRTNLVELLKTGGVK